MRLKPFIGEQNMQSINLDDFGSTFGVGTCNCWKEWVKVFLKHLQHDIYKQSFSSIIFYCPLHDDLAVKAIDPAAPEKNSLTLKLVKSGPKIII